LYCAANFGIVLVLGNEKTKSLETSIYISAVENLDLPKAATLVLIQSLLTLSLFLAVSRFSRSTTNPFGSWDRSADRLAKVRDLPAVIMTLLVTIGFVVFPLFSIVWRSFHFEGHATVGNFLRLGSYGARNALSISLSQAFANSVRNALVSLVISLGIGLLLAFLLLRTRSHLLGLIFQLPLGISPVVIGLGYLITFPDGIFPLRSSWLVTPLAQSMVLIPLVLQIVIPAMHGIGQELKDSAQVDGCDDSIYWWTIQIPLARKAIRLAAIYVIVVSMGEFGAANFLAYGDQATLPTVLYQLISHPGAINYGMALAASTFLILVAGGILSIAL
jgi:thiamine transport system permease protein